MVFLTARWTGEVYRLFPEALVFPVFGFRRRREPRVVKKGPGQKDQGESSVRI